MDLQKIEYLNQIWKNNLFHIAVCVQVGYKVDIKTRNGERLRKDFHIYIQGCQPNYKYG